MPASEENESRAREILDTFYDAAEAIQADSDLTIDGLLGLATAEEGGYAVECTYSSRLSPEDFGTILGTLIGTHAAQHDWTPRQISGFLLRVVSNREVSGSSGPVFSEAELDRPLFE